MPAAGSHSASASRRTSRLLRLPGKRRTSTSSPTDAPTSRSLRRARSSGPWPTVSRGTGSAYRVGMGEAAARTSLWRFPALRALVGATTLGFAGYCLTLASLPAYAVAGGAPVTTAGAVTTVFLLVTIALQMTVPALTARFGIGPVLAVGLVLLGAPAPLYVLDDGLGWLCAVSAVRGAGFAVLSVLGSTLAALVARPERRGESIGLYGLAIAVPNLVAVPGGVALVLAGHTGWL